MKKKITYLAVFFVTSLFLKAQISQKWLQLGTGTPKNQTSQPSMAFDRHGNLFLAYTDQSTPQNKATLKKFDGQTWTTLSNNFTPGQAQFIKLELDTAGVPYVAFQEPYPVTKKISVMKYNGTGWDTVGIRGFATADFNNPEISMNIDFNNNIQLAYRENATGKASVISYYGINWSFVNSANITEGDATKLSMAARGSHYYLAFSNGHRGGKLSVITQTIGGAWVYVGDTTLSTGPVDYITCKIFGGTNNVFTGITFKDLSDDKAYLLSKTDFGIWSNVNSTPQSEGTANYVCLAKKRTEPFNGKYYCGYADGTSGGNATVKQSHATVANGVSLVGKKGFTDTLGIFAGAFYATMGIDKYDSLYIAVQSFNEYVVFKYRSINLNLAGIPQSNFNAQISIFPNPSNGHITTSIDNSLPYSMKLFNLDGKVLFENHSEKGEDLTIDISNKTNGVYYIEIKQNDKLTRTKVIKN
ncbi:T9SS type A sorting domain-containing protein [Aurantibacillus circumpalustris]|uniref:T9SS type A sorting domain-containing protein n=1 Tax=Aurantibacillus circumpalustris TaxID=3036359 RepID=UPI00295B1DED|nr:T9SS type A sorting domain-containing protein [Aurantibacillus circumpalustris]